MHSLGLVVGQSTPPLSQSVSHTPPALNDGHHATQVTIQVALVHRRRFHLSPPRSFFREILSLEGKGFLFPGDPLNLKALALQTFPGDPPLPNRKL